MWHCAAVLPRHHVFHFQPTRCLRLSTSFHVKPTAKRLPCFLVAKFFGYNLPEFEPQTVCYFLRQIRMWAATKNLDVRHFVGSPGPGSVQASCCRVQITEEPGTKTKFGSTVKELLLRLFPICPPLCQTQSACGPSSLGGARTLSVTFLFVAVTSLFPETPSNILWARYKNSLNIKLPNCDEIWNVSS